MPSPKSESLRTYIAALPVGAAPKSMAEDAAAVNTIDVNALPNGLVTGSNLIQFPPKIAADLKSSITMSLLAAQRVATNDPVVATPDQWIERHNTVLKNLNWLIEDGGVAEASFKTVGVAVHQAILPLLTAALGPAAAAGSLIITALEQLQKMDQDAPWITLFERQSRRFEVTEYQFTVVEVQGNTVRLRLASARLGAEFGSTQVLFFRVTQQSATFNMVKQAYSADADLLADLNGDLKTKMSALSKSFIRSLPDKLLLGTGGG